MHTFYEFFAGGGMARLGLGVQWQCLFANDFSLKKAAVYRANFPDASAVLSVRDIATVRTNELPGVADLVWASFPCQDLSLAGSGVGLDGSRSGALWPFLDLVGGLISEQRSPRILVLENVPGLLTSRDGDDFRILVQALSARGFRVGALTMDALHFVPQSRPRLFIVCVSASVAIADDLSSEGLGSVPRAEQHWYSRSLRAAYTSLPEHLKQRWVWWRIRAADPRHRLLQDLLEPDDALEWHSADQTDRLIGMMSDTNRSKLDRAKSSGRPTVGTIYRRTRHGVQRAEVRFDGVSGCLRTPEGGSSRQTIITVNGERVRSRLLSAREAARLMGLPDSYRLPCNYNDAYHVAGDGLVVPVVAWLAENILGPLLSQAVTNDKPPIRDLFNPKRVQYA